MKNFLCLALLLNAISGFAQTQTSPDTSRDVTGGTTKEEYIFMTKEYAKGLKDSLGAPSGYSLGKESTFVSDFGTHYFNFISYVKNGDQPRLAGTILFIQSGTGTKFFGIPVNNLDLLQDFQLKITEAYTARTLSELMVSYIAYVQSGGLVR